MDIRQGDAYTWEVTLTDENETPLTPDNVSKVEISIGNLTKTFPGEVEYDAENGLFRMFITETDSHSMRGILPTLVRVLFPTGYVSSATFGYVYAVASVSDTILGEQAQQE